MDAFEKAGEKIREEFYKETKSGQSERRLIADFLSDVFDETGDVTLMESSLDELITACEGWKKFLKDMPRKE